MGLKKRCEVNPEDCWRLEDLYETDRSWEADVRKVEREIEEFRGFAGTLTDGADALLRVLRAQEEMERRVERVYVYANMRWHEDTGNGKYQKMAGQSGRLLSRVSDAQAFLEPEILAMPEDVLSGYLAVCEKLKLYERYFSEIRRQREHVLSAGMEAVLAKTQGMADAPQQIFMNFNNADLKFGEITGADGEPVEVTHGSYGVLLKSKDRMVRQQAFASMYVAYEKYQNTLAATMDANAEQARFFADIRKYPSARAMAMEGAHIPEAVYDGLIDAVHEGFPLMYRYMELRKQILGVDELHMYDLYVPLTNAPEKKYTFAEAKAIVKEALGVMGAEYTGLLQKGFDEGWIDIYENEGKRSGAYSWGCYDEHPYVLLNFQGSLADVFTLAHEMGHAIHSYYSHQDQPYIYAGYRIFVAEVASICNEMLLVQYLIGRAEDREEKKYLINYLLEQFRTTLYRQTMFAEFENIIHQKKGQGQTLAAEDLKQIYYELNTKYFGPDTCVDPEIAMEWARIPHFYTPFYVYQYATGFAAALSISHRILAGEKNILENYRKFLGGGCSMDCIDLLKLCGVDMAEPTPVREALGIFDKYLADFAELF